MIKITKKSTKVVFAKNSIGTISVDMNKTLNTLTLQEMKVEKKVGADLTEEDYKSLPKVELEFNNIASIDVVIKQLETLRTKMAYPYGFPAYYLAC